MWTQCRYVMRDKKKWAQITLRPLKQKLMGVIFWWVWHERKLNFNDCLFRGCYSSSDVHSVGWFYQLHPRSHCCHHFEYSTWNHLQGAPRSESRTGPSEKQESYVMGPRAGDDEEERGQQWGIPEATVPDQNGMGKLTFQNLCVYVIF